MVAELVILSVLGIFGMFCITVIALLSSASVRREAIRAIDRLNRWFFG